MEFLYTTEVPIPLYQIGLLLILSTVSLLMGRIKLALVVNYLFTLYWGWVLNHETLLKGGAGMADWFSVFYLGFGFVVAILALVGFLTHSE